MRRAVPVLLLAALLCSARAGAQATLPADFADDLIVGGLTTPAAMAFVPDGPAAAGTRLLFVEQRNGRMRLVVNGALSSQDPVGVVPNVRSNDFYRGLLGIALDPHWPAHPYVYVHAHRADSVLIAISRFTLTGDLDFTGDGKLSFDPASRYDLLRNVTGSLHSGGTLRFGPDSLLYASVGDGYSTPCSAQDTTALTGKILRLEVRDLPPGPGGPPARPLITPAGNPFVGHPNANARLVWAMGLRNPFRFHVDAETGALLEGDVGQFTWEEVNYMTTPGADYGWPLYEGPDPYTTCAGVADAGFEKGIYWYGGGQSVITAGVYRRAASRTGNFPSDYEGDAFVSDYYDGGMRRLKRGETAWDLAPPVPGQPSPTLWATGLQNVADYAQAPDGTLWYLKQSVSGGANTGQIRRIRYAGALGADEPRARGVALAAPSPNPARGAVRFAFTLARPAQVELSVLDAAGRRVATPLAGARPAGAGEAVWDGRGPGGGPCPPGLYFAVLRAGGETRVRRLALAR